MTTTRMITRDMITTDMITEWERRMRYRMPLICFSALLLLCGCLATGPDLVRSGQVRLMGPEDSPWRVLYAQARTTQDGLRVSGRARLRSVTALRPRGHLDVVATSREGVQLARETAKLHPSGGFRRRYRTASFGATLGMSPLGTGQVIVHLTYCVAKH